MSCEHLVCATCAGRVVEGRCLTCRTARAELHRHGNPAAAQLLALLAVLAVLAALFLAVHPGG
jgi:hypothetical protein